MVDSVEQRRIEDVHAALKKGVVDPSSCLKFPLWCHQVPSIAVFEMVLQCKALKASLYPNELAQRDKKNDAEEVFFSTQCVAGHVSKYNNNSLSNLILPGLRKQNLIYRVSSGSLTTDNSVIFRRYGKNKGISIVFYSNRMIRPNPIVPCMGRVEYGLKAYEEYYFGVFENFLTEYHRIAIYHDPASRQTYIDSLIAALFSTIFTVIPLIKNDMWNDENEVRLFYPDYRNIWGIEDVFFPINLNAIAEVVLGSECTDVDFERVMYLKKKYKLSFNVRFFR